MRAASCSVITVSSPARPGATIFGPPLKPAKKCGSTKPVVMRTSAPSQKRLSHSPDAGDGAPGREEHRRVPRVVIDHAIAVQDLAAEHPFELGRRVRAMRAGGDQDRHVFRPHVRHLVEERREHLASRLRARHVADRDGDRPTRASQRRKRRTAAQRRTYGGTRASMGSSTAGPLIGSITVTRSSGRVTSSPFVPKSRRQRIRTPYTRGVPTSAASRRAGSNTSLPVEPDPSTSNSFSSDAARRQDSRRRPVVPVGPTPC